MNQSIVNQRKQIACLLAKLCVQLRELRIADAIDVPQNSFTGAKP